MKQLHVLRQRYRITARTPVLAECLENRLLLSSPVVNNPDLGNPTYIYGGNPVAQFLSVLEKQSSTLIYAHDVGAVGDGVVDDAPALQAAINNAPEGYTLVLDAGKTYRLGKGLIIEHNINFEGNGATLRLDTAAWPDNEAVIIRSPLSAESFTWTAPVTAGQTTFAVSVPLEKLSPGSMVFLELGQDPNDPCMPHWSRMVKVIANTGSSITIDTPVPYDIIQGQFANRLRVATTYVQGISVHDVRFDQTDRALPDAQIWVDRAANVSIDTLSGRFTIAAQVTNSQNITVRNITGQLTQPHGAAGRVLGVWQSDNVSLSDVNVTSDSNTPAVFLESWSHNTSVSNFTIDYQITSGSISDIFHVTGGSYDTNFDKICIQIELEGLSQPPAPIAASAAGKTVTPSQQNQASAALARVLAQRQALLEQKQRIDATKAALIKSNAPQITVALVAPARMIKSGQSAAVDFGSAGLGRTGASRVFRVTNTGSVNMATSQMSIPSGYQLVKGLPKTLAPGKSGTFTLKLLTRKAGKYSGQVSFMGAKSSFRFSITGTVTAK